MVRLSSDSNGCALGDVFEPRTRVFQRIDAAATGRVSQADVHELAAVEKIQRDVPEIYTRPFDTGVVVRLSVIVFSVTAIGSAPIIVSLLGF